jgi:hypothetical protein
VSLTQAARHFGKPTQVIQVGNQERPSKAVSSLIQALREGGAAVDLENVKLPPFWNLVGYVDCRPLIERTAEWLVSP